MKKRILKTVFGIVLSATFIGTIGMIGTSFATPLSVWSEVDWEVVGSEIDSAPGMEAAQKQTKVIDVCTGEYMNVPMETLRKMAGKNVALAMHAGEVAVSAFGWDVTTASRELTITLTDEEDEIPEYVSRKILLGALYSKMFAMEEKNDYEIPLNIHFSLGKDYAGKYANLYHFDEQADDMVYDNSFIITSGGMAMFSLDRGDEYILTVTDELCSGGRTEYTVVAGDNLTRIAEKIGISLKTLLATNPGIEDADKIYPCQILAIVK